MRAAPNPQNNPPNINILRNPPRRARQVLGRGPVPQPVGPVPQPVGPVPHPVGNIFMQYCIYVLCKGYVPNSTDSTYYTIFCQQFILTLTGIVYTWFKQIQDNFNDINDVKASFLKRFNKWGQTVKQHMTAWNSLKFDVQKHDMDMFTRKLKLLASILYMTDEQTLEKFKDLFDMTIAAHLIECTTLAEAREKAEQLVFLYKSTTPISAATVLIHNSLPETKEVNEHQLAPVTKQDKKGFNPREKP